MNKFIIILTFFISACSDNSPSHICQTYKGILPAASSEGIETTIEFNNKNQFNSKIIYLGEDDATFIEKGKYSIANNIIETKSENEIAYYRLENDQIRLLDYHKKPITGVLEKHYILAKTKSCD